MTIRDHRLSVSERLRRVQSPVIPVVGHWARENPGTLSLGQGIVHYPPPKEVEEALLGFFSDPANHRYQLVDGIEPLLNLIRTKLTMENAIAVDDLAVTVTAGANMGFMNAVMAICDPGDEVILLSPFYFNHDMALTMLNIRVIAVQTDDQYQPDLNLLKESITPRTRAVVSISPNNPSGAVYAEKTLRDLNRICAERGIYHIHDQAYEYFLHEDEVSFSPASIAGTEGHTITLFSLSKAFGFAGWRIGYMVYPIHLQDAVRKVQDTNLICAPVVSQVAAVAAMKQGKDYCLPYIREISQVRLHVIEALKEVEDVCRINSASGAFYFLLDLDTPLAVELIAQRLVYEHKVATIPARAFGIEDRCVLRIAYGALKQRDVMEGIGRLVQGLKAILRP